MLKSFPIDFIRQTFEQRLLEEHIKNLNLFGGKEQVSIHSFYEQLKGQDEVDRFVETYRDLADQQNRTGLILNGVLVSPENPSITNLYSCMIIPMVFTCSLRCTLGNRDQAINTINNLIEKLKGKKVDIAELECDGDTHVPFVVGTIGQNDGKPTLKDSDYIGEITTTNDIPTIISNLKNNLGVDIPSIEDRDLYLYVSQANKLKVCRYGKNVRKLTFAHSPSITVDGQYVYAEYEINEVVAQADLVQPIIGNIRFSTIGGTQTFSNIEAEIVSCVSSSSYTTLTLKFDIEETVSDYLLVTVNADVYKNEIIGVILEDDGTNNKIAFPPEHTSFAKYKMSFSFDAIRCDEPRNLNGEEYCELSFGGSATLVNNGVKLGNDLLKISVSKYKIPADTDITFDDNIAYLEPLEMPSGNNINTNPNQLVSNLFKTNAHADAIALTLQYTFIVDENIAILNQWYDDARYGTLGTSQNQVSPNLIYKVHEYYCSWGNYTDIEILTKVVGDMDIENTESDTLTISLSMQILGENN